MRLLLATVVCWAVCQGNPIRAVDQASVTSALNALVALDQRTDAGVVLAYQNMASKTHFDHDNAPNPLFTSVDATILQRPSFVALSQVLGYYTHPNVDTAEVLNAFWNSSMHSFITTIQSTPVVQSAWQFLQQQGLSTASATDFHEQLYSLWFSMYARNTVVGSSGFESLFAGEVSGTNVIRSNNWVRFQQLESQGLLNYHGFFTKENGVQLDTQYSWGTWQAVEESMLLNTSPEFEIAVYTVCALSGGSCSMTIKNFAVQLTASVITKNGVMMIDQCSPSGTAATGATTKKPAAGATTKKATSNNDPQLQTLVTQMRAQDVDKPAPSDYTLNWGNKVSGTKDVSPLPLFTQVNENIFKRPVYSVLINVFDKNLFVPDVCGAEVALTGYKQAALQNVLDTWTATDVFQLAFNYLKQKGFKQATDMATLKTYLFNLWFGTYSRCSGKMGSSGWEHVFSGEWKSNTIDGQHDWTRYYLLEKAKQINYYGYFSYDGSLTGTFQYDWQGNLKKEGGFLFGTSPAFDFSLLTVCALMHPGANACQFQLDGYQLAVTSYTQACDAGTCLSTAYPTN